MNHPGSHANALHAKFPDKLILIAGDDDQHLEASQGINPGRSKAEEAAKAVGGIACANSLAAMTTQFAMCAGFHGHSAMVLLTKRKKSVP
jgi:phage/plasmid primase-like uncharacterized protein